MSNILLTGHSGFLGSYLKTYLISKGHTIIKLGRSDDSDIVCDLGKETFESMELDYVIHAAGKAHVTPKSQEQIDDFYKVNYQGTRNLIRSISNSNIKTFIFISTVAVYGKDVGELIDEESPLLGNTPYALSKIQAEQSIIDFGIDNNIKTVVLRLPLVTGTNPLGNLAAIINAIKKGYYFRIGKGEARKSVIAASDLAILIPELFNLNGVYNLTDIHHPMIAEIDSIIAEKYNKRIKILPTGLIRIFAKIGDLFLFSVFNSSKYDKLTRSLTFSNEKLFNDIKYRPSRGLADISNNL